MRAYYRCLGLACGALAVLSATRGWGDATAIFAILVPAFFLLAGRRR